MVTLTALPPLLMAVTSSEAFATPAPPGLNWTAWLLKRPIQHFSMWTSRRDHVEADGARAVTDGLSIARLRSVTFLPTALMMIPWVAAARTPACDPSPSMVSDLVMVTAPKPPESSTLMKPPSAVLLIAPANVLHGAVRLQVRVVADAGYPRPGRLRMRQREGEAEERNKGHRAADEDLHSHNPCPP